MATILLRVPIEAEPKAVYDTLATSEGITGWWSNHTDGPRGVGSTISVSFPDAPASFDFEVVQDQPNERVAWRCLEGPPEWIGTLIRFDIEGTEGNTSSVRFAHDGWLRTEESFPFIAYSWAQILPRLKALAEAGKRDPFFNF